MNLFVIAAGIMVVVLMVAGARRPRLSVIVAAILWLAYAVYEHLVASGVLCDANCNIRVDLLLIFPILAVATAYARASYVRPPEQQTIVGWVLGAIGLAIAALLSWAFGYIAPAAVAGVCALAIVGYVIKVKFAPSTRPVN